MKKPWYKKSCLWVVTLLVVLAIPFLINEAYKSDVKHYFTMWNAADVLSFYGSFLSFIGATVLGVVALDQSRKANQLSERMLDAEERREIPIIDISGVNSQDILEKGTLENALHITVNESFYFFAEDNTIEEADTEVYIFQMENISSTHIISLEIAEITAKTYFDNGKYTPCIMERLRYSSGLYVLRSGESQYMIIGGILSGNQELNDDERYRQGYTTPRVELEILLKLGNTQGRIFKEKIRIQYINTTNISNVRYPCVIKKEIVSFGEVKK